MSYPCCKHCALLQVVNPALHTVPRDKHIGRCPKGCNEPRPQPEVTR